jgi:hypothetical protein
MKASVRGSTISIYRCACSPHGLGVWQMASPAPVATPMVLGPGRLGQRYRIVCCLSTTPEGKPAGHFADVYRVELDPPPPRTNTYAAKVLKPPVATSDPGGLPGRTRSE